MEQQQILKQDGYLDLGIFVSNEVDGGVVTRTYSNNSNNGVTSEARHIVYHPNLNVILAFDTNNHVKVLDVHSGVILQSYQLASNESDKIVNGRFMPLQEKVLFWDGNVIGFRGDYNGVLLLDTILQAPTMQNDDIIKIELLLSEAIIFQNCLKDLEEEGLECTSDVSNELQEKIQKALNNPKKGIKAQRWATICLEVPYSSLKLVANNVVIILKRLERHIPVLAIASAINERLTDLLVGARMPDLSMNSISLQRVLMHSEAVRRQTFEKWPHMDYKWALPDQMAQAGFYHQPSTTGEDRAMCFTCSVCLVCWEKTDEPWGEHERHSPTCPFVKGEYTQNVPLSVTYATNPAVPVPGLGFDVISNSDYANVLCTSCTKTGDLTIWSIERHLKKMHTVNIATLMKDICDESYEWARVTAICVLPNERAKKKITAMQAVQTGQQGGTNQQHCTSTSTLRNGVVGSKVVLGMSIRQTTGEHALRLVVLNIVESDKIIEESDDDSCEGSGDGGGGDNILDLHEIYNQEDPISLAAVKEKQTESLEESQKPQNEHQKQKQDQGRNMEDDDEDEDTKVPLTLIALDYSTKMDDLGAILEDVEHANLSKNEADSVKKKLIEVAHLIQNKNHNNIVGHQGEDTHNTIANSDAIKMILNEEIDCIVDSCTSINRMNALSNLNENNEKTSAKLVEISEIIPTSSDCNQLLVKLEKNKVPNENKTQIIMEAMQDEDEQMQECTQINSANVSAQLLLFDVVDSVISNEYTLAVAFSKEKCPKQLCILPALTLQNERRNSDANIRSIFEVGAISVVCADGTIELYSLLDSSLIASINEENEKFVSVAYCRSLDRLCACTKTGGLFFYTLNDADTDSSDECIEMEDDTTTAAATINSAAQQNVEVSVTDGIQQNLVINNKDEQSSVEQELISPRTTATTSAASAITMTSPTGCSPSSSGVATVNSNSTPVLLANKQEDLTIEDLKTLYALTLFDEKLGVYTAEVSNCWNDLGQTQKQRKQTQAADETQFFKTWRLHNDSTTWDEHLIELNLSQQMSLGHIDLKFTLYQLSQNPATGIQVTLLKQNTSSFGYRMKGPQLNFKASSTDKNPEATFNSYENSVLNEEYLQAHNAEIIAGPIELSSCIDIYEHGGTAVLTSPKLFKTRTRNFLLHIKTVNDPTKDGQNKLRGCDWFHEISIYVRGVKSQRRIANERLQRISMLESNILIHNLFKIVSDINSSKLERNLSLDILIWICFIRLNRFRSPKSERIKDQINKATAAQHSDLLAQQFECLCITENYLEGMIRYALIQSDRSMAHKCVKLLMILIQGNRDLPTEIRAHSTIVTSIMKALTNTFSELTSAKYASVVRWYITLICAVSDQENNHEIANLCVKMLSEITEEIGKRPDPHGYLLSARYGLYGFPFDVELFDFDLPNLTKGIGSATSASTSQLINVLRPNPILLQTAGMDINKLSSIDGVDFRTFPHLIKCKSISNQFRGLLEVEQLHFNCIATSESTRIDTLDITNSAAAMPSTSAVNMDDLMITPLQAYAVQQKDPLTIFEDLIDMEDNSTIFQKSTNDVKSNGNIGIDLSLTPSKSASSSEQTGCKYKVPLLPKIKAICKFIENCDDISSETKEINQAKAEQSLSDESTGLDEKALSLHNLSVKVSQYIEKQLFHTKDFGDKVLQSSQPKVQFHQYIGNEKEYKPKSQSGSQNQKPAKSKKSDHAISIPKQSENKSREAINNINITSNTPIAWHKVLTTPPKQMIVIDRMHSGARRHVVLDFGSPIILTDLVIPPCDELASLHIDVWCLDEETDSQRLVNCQDIALKTLVLSDLQPAPICRYLKITIIGRIGMSSTKCKVPIGCFFGHSIILEQDAYGDPLIAFMKSPPSYIQMQLKALYSLYEDVNCRYNLSASKLCGCLTPLIFNHHSNEDNMRAFIKKQKEDENSSENADSQSEANKVVGLYEECILLQHQLNIIRNVIQRLECNSTSTISEKMPENVQESLALVCSDKLRVLSLSLVEVLLHFSIDFGIKNILPLHETFDANLAKQLFNSLVLHGDAHIQLATCSLLVRMCCFQSWWGDFIADLFCNLFSPQNYLIFPQDRIFFLLTYLGRRSIAMGSCRSIFIDAILKTLAKFLTPVSGSPKADHQLITWLLLFLSICLDDNDREDKISRWDFMSCENDFGKSKVHCSIPVGKHLRCFKKRIVQQNKFGVQPYCDWNKKIFMLQNEHLMEATGKPTTATKISKTSSKTGASLKPSTSATSSANQKDRSSGNTPINTENNFEKGFKTLRLNNILVVIRGLIAFLLDMDFYCNMDQFLLTCEVIARLVSACRPVIQISKIISTAQLEQLVRLTVWNDRQQPWAVHAITCLLQDLLEADISKKPSEIEDEEYDFLYEIELLDQAEAVAKKESGAYNKSTFAYFCKAISKSMDYRLDIGLELNVETQLRHMANDSSLDLYSSLPQVLADEFVMNPGEPPNWPDYILDAWSGPQYNSNHTSLEMFTHAFDGIFSDLHLEDTWVHLEQVLQLWLTLNGDIPDKKRLPLNSEVAKIPFGPNAIQGLLAALAWHSDVKLRTWCLGFQCLYLACINPSDVSIADESYAGRMIIYNENFEKMLLRFFSGYGMNSNISNRYAGPTICKRLHELLIGLWQLYVFSDHRHCIKKFKDILLRVVLQLIQPGGAITNHQGPTDAQCEMIKVLLRIEEKTESNLAMKIIESVSFLVYNHVVNEEKIHCLKGSDLSKLGFPPISHSQFDQALIVALIKLAISLIQEPISPETNEETVMPEEPELVNSQCQTDEVKVEQLNNEMYRTRKPCIADLVLKSFPTMKRFLGILSLHYTETQTIKAYYYVHKLDDLVKDPLYIFDNYKCVLDGIFLLLHILNEKATHPKLIISPICQYLEAGSNQRNALPRLQLSQPFLTFVSKILRNSTAVHIFTQLGGIQTICKNLVQLNKILYNMEPGLISLLMNHMTRNSKYRLIGAGGSSGGSNGSNSKKTSISTQSQSNPDGLINFAPFCTIRSDSEEDQCADILIINPIVPHAHRRQRAPSWSYMFNYDKNKYYVNLTIALPAAVLLHEIQLQPHTPTLASCPSAVAIEISRDYHLAPIPLGPPIKTAGLTCIRLKLKKPEIASVIVLRLYRPKDSLSIGLTQIAVLGHTIFTTGGSLEQGAITYGTISDHFHISDQYDYEDSFAKTSVGWVRMLSNCFNTPAMFRGSKLAQDVIGTAATYPGLLDACCSLMNVLPMIPESGLHRLEKIMLQLGTFDINISLDIIKTLLWRTTPQVFRVYNENICDLLYKLGTLNDGGAVERIKVFLDWVVNLKNNYSVEVKCNNPQSGYVRVVSAVLWTVYTENYMTCLADLITPELFESCLYWTSNLVYDCLKRSFDSLLCSICCIKPELFYELLKHFNINIVEGLEVSTKLSKSGSKHQLQQPSQESKEQTYSNSLTDDKKDVCGSEWYAKVARKNLSTLLGRSGNLETLAAAAKSPLAIHQLSESGLLKLLAYAIYDFCCTLSPEVKRICKRNDSFEGIDESELVGSSSVLIPPLASGSSAAFVANSVRDLEGSGTSCQIDADKIGKRDYAGNLKQESQKPFLLTGSKISLILDFFSYCCSEAHMIEWLGTKHGTIFWRPLLELLCNYRPSASEQLGNRNRLECATINFFSRITSAHYKNSEIFTGLLISVIRKDDYVDLDEGGGSTSSSAGACGPSTTGYFGSRSFREMSTISGFTRQLVLQLLLEDEKTYVSIRSKLPIQRTNVTAPFFYSDNTTSAHHLSFDCTLNVEVGVFLSSLHVDEDMSDDPLKSGAIISSMKNSAKSKKRSAKSERAAKMAAGIAGLITKPSMGMVKLASGSSATESSATGSTGTGSSAIGSSVTGSSAIGSTSIGSSAIGSSAIGSSVTGSSTTGSSMTGSSATGSSEPGSSAPGSSASGSSASGSLATGSFATGSFVNGSFGTGSSATESSATESSATESSATESSATESSATESSVTESSVTGSSATGSFASGSSATTSDSTSTTATTPTAAESGSGSVSKNDEKQKITYLDEPMEIFNSEMDLNLNGLENGMEFLSVAAGVTAKGKRIKDVKNQAAANKDASNFSKQNKNSQNIEENIENNSVRTAFVLSNVENVVIPENTTLSQLLAIQQAKGLPTCVLNLELVIKKADECLDKTVGDNAKAKNVIVANTVEPLQTPLQRFSKRGGLSLLAKYLPTVYPECTVRKTPSATQSEKEKSPVAMSDWVTLEPNDIYEDLEDPISEPIVKNINFTAVPQHSLAAFGLFLRLPAYSDILLKDMWSAQCLLRLVLGFTGDGEGNDIYSSSLAPKLPTLPFQVFRKLLDSSPLNTDDGILLRKMVIDVGAMHLVLSCLSVFTHQTQNSSSSHTTNSGNASNTGGNKEAAASASGNVKMSSTSAEDNVVNTSDDKSHVYWAKGTGFGTGSTAQSWNVEQALLRQKSEEEHVTILLQVLSSYINPGDCIPPSLQNEDIVASHKVSEGVSTELPKHFYTLLEKSCLIPALSSYLRNDSVMDITRHIPLYRAILQLLRALTLSHQLVTLLQPNEEKSENSPSIAELLNNMKTCVDTYAKRLKINKKSVLKGQQQSLTQQSQQSKQSKQSQQSQQSQQQSQQLLQSQQQQQSQQLQQSQQQQQSQQSQQQQTSQQHQQQSSTAIDDSDDEGLALLIPDIQETSFLVQKTTNADVARRQQKRLDEQGENGQLVKVPPVIKSLEERYLEVMKKLQFDTYDMIVEAENNGFRFTISHHFEKTVRMAGDRYHPSRVKRLAQEAVTLSTSLPLSYSSSVFVRCDTDRLDVMKVLITGPAETPYANGCFEFDVFFPPDYPNLPMLINLETTGRHSVRFNPNLYNDGKVCLSVLNTWHGRPEEKWNAQTSSFLQVLVSIQSLILVPEPYFNEPGFERSRGTPNGTQSSREYNTNIYQACVRWAMMEQIRNPSPCFKEIIHTHFWLKRNEICEQIENWIEELGKPQYNERNSRTVSFNTMVLRRHYRHLREELAKLPVPEGLEDMDAPFSPSSLLPSDFPITTSSVTGTGPSATGSNVSNMSSEHNVTVQSSPASPDHTPSSSQSCCEPNMDELNINVDLEKLNQNTHNQTQMLQCAYLTKAAKQIGIEELLTGEQDPDAVSEENLKDITNSTMEPSAMTLLSVDTEEPNVLEINSINQVEDGHDVLMEIQSESVDNNANNEDVAMPLYIDNDVVLETSFAEDMDTSFDDA